MDNGKNLPKNTWIIIVHYNGIEWIEKCLNSFNESTFSNQIIVIDNNSPQKEGKEVIKRKFPKVKLIELTENIGFGRANNVGIEFAIEQQAEFVFLLNQDAWLVDNNTIETLIAVGQEYPEFAIISPVHYNSSQDCLDEGFATYLATSKNWQWASDTFFKQSQKIYSIPFVNAAAWLLNVKSFQKIGLFDKAFFMYGEDVDLVHRTIFHQKKIGFVPHTKIVHARENRPKTIDKTTLSYAEKMQFYGQYLAIINNINVSLPKAFITFMIQWIVMVGQQLNNKYWRRTMQLFRIGLNIIGSLPKVYTSRKYHKKGYLN